MIEPSIITGSFKHLVREYGALSKSWDHDNILIKDLKQMAVFDGCIRIQSFRPTRLKSLDDVFPGSFFSPSSRVVYPAWNAWEGLLLLHVLGKKWLTFVWINPKHHVVCACRTQHTCSDMPEHTSPTSFSFLTEPTLFLSPQWRPCRSSRTLPRRRLPAWPCSQPSGRSTVSSLVGLDGSDLWRARWVRWYCTVDDTIRDDYR